jgi:hypothetical protein
MPYKNTKHRTRRQRQQRRAGHVRRVEVVLSADNPEDQAIHDVLDRLPRGEISAFIRQAILEKIERDKPAPEPTAADQFNAILAELSALRGAVNPAPASPVAVEQLEAENALLRERIDIAEQQVKQLERQLQSIATQDHQTGGSEEASPTSADDARQRLLSAKLKRLSFANL